MDTNIDTNNQINIDYYKNAAIDIISREIDQAGLDPRHLKNNQIKTFLRSCYHKLFKPEKPRFNNYACNIQYTEYNIRALLMLYIEICEKYFCIPSLLGFSVFTGITEEITAQYVTDARLIMQKARADYTLNGLADTPIGLTVIANNDQSTGLLFNRQNMLDRHTITQNISVSDFVKIAQNDAET